MTITRNLNEIKYENLSKEYYLKEKTFTCQYAPLYAERLKSMREEVKKAALKKWPSNKYPIKNLVDMETNEKCIIIGTLYKEMKNKPNILKELAEDENNQIVMQPVLNREKYIDVDDELILEDELQRIVLIDSSNIDSQSPAAKNIIKDARLCTGLVIALVGFENEDSKFEIEDYCFKETPLLNHVSLKNPTENIENHKYIVFVSGIELGDPKTNENMYKFQLFIDFLRGDFNQIDTKLNDYESSLNRMLKNTIRLVIAGNSLSSSTQSKDMHNKAKYLTKNFVAGSVSAIKELDKFISQLIDKIEVDLMPGEYDPSNLMLPQQPLHNAIFTASKHNNSNTNTSNNFHTTTNPYRFSLNNINFLGTSGQFIDDIRRSTNVDNSIELMKLTLEAGHIGPTCPDTLACYPFYGKDPFILNSLPNVFFAGNQNEFKHDIYTDKWDKNANVHLLSLPKFSTTNSCVFFNLDTFQSEQIFF